MVPLSSKDTHTDIFKGQLYRLERVDGVDQRGADDSVVGQQVSNARTCPSSSVGERDWPALGGPNIILQPDDDKQ